MHRRVGGGGGGKVRGKVTEGSEREPSQVCKQPLSRKKQNEREREREKREDRREKREKATCGRCEEIPSPNGIQPGAGAEPGAV